jgi:hypothetical protein
MADTWIDLGDHPIELRSAQGKSALVTARFEPQLY